MRIDAHQHFWELSRGDYRWLTSDLAAIYRDFIPLDLSPLLKAANIDGTILVQAAPTIAETEYLLSIAANTPFVKGVVGWVDFEAPNAVEEIAYLAQNPALKGLRPMIHDIADPNWMLGNSLAGAFEAMIAHGLTFDALTRPQHLKPLKQLLVRYPDLRCVIDHASKPDIARNEIEPWASDIAALARETTVYCKISGLVTEATLDWTAGDIIPYTEHLLKTFGPERLIWGSDWPVCTLATSYQNWFETAQDCTLDLTDVEQAQIFGGNAARAYKLR